jgi:Fe-S-cluster containining protein
MNARGRERGGHRGRSAKVFWEDGLRFACQGSGKCCMSRGAYGYVYVTLRDRRRLAEHLGLTTRQFTRQYCARTGLYFHLLNPEADCGFLHEKRCLVYEARPAQCRTWPFWPENMKPRVWNNEVAAYCPGVGKGRLYTKAEINRILLGREEVGGTQSC